MARRTKQSAEVQPAQPEKTGGTPHGGRLAPGKEGRGRCRRQRFPEILAEMPEDVERLYRQATDVAEFLGHQKVVLWRVEEEGTSGSVRCQNCKMVAGFAKHPMYEKIYKETYEGPKLQKMVPREKVNGPLVEQRCPRG